MSAGHTFGELRHRLYAPHYVKPVAIALRRRFLNEVNAVGPVFAAAAVPVERDDAVREQVLDWAGAGHLWCNCRTIDCPQCDSLGEVIIPDDKIVEAMHGVSEHPMAGYLMLDFMFATRPGVDSVEAVFTPRNLEQLTLWVAIIQTGYMRDWRLFQRWNRQQYHLGYARVHRTPKRHNNPTP